MKRISLIIFVIGVVLSSCSNLKKLPEGEKLYTGAKIRFRDKPQKQKALTQELEGLLRPKPNSKFLGMRVRLSLYNLGREPKPGKKGLNHLLRNKWGEPPVLFSSVRPEFTSRVLRNHLENNGYFEANSFFNIEHKEKTASVTYTIRAGQQYRINEVYFPEDSSRVSSILRESSRESLLKPGNPFNLDLIKEERERLDLALKEQGFFYFSPENLIIQVDSTLRGLVNLYIKVKDNTPVIVRHPYYINQVKIFANYSLTEDSALQEIPGRKYRNFILVDPDSLFKPSIFRRSVFLKPDSVYRRSSHNITLRRLVSLGPFKFIRADFDRIPDSSRHLLNATIYLTPYPKRTIQLQVNGSSKSNNFVASELRLQMKNRNWFRGAEMLELNFGGGYETQIGGEQLSTNSYTLNGDINVYFPSFVSPFKLINPRIPFVPRTRISAGFELLNRANLYTLRAIKGSYGYNWRQSTRIEHTFNPFTMSYTQPDNITAEFQQILDQDLALRQSFEKQFLIGGNYTLQFNNQTESKLWNTSFVEFEADVSGNLIGLIAKKSAVSGQKQIF
ncbi:MAG TPA: hypothetical protein VIK74_11430, partial [Parasegetibacter sp.]